MQFPVTITLGPVAVPLHAVLETLAFFAGFRYFLYLRRRQGDAYTDNARTWVIAGAIIGALAGSRLLGALEKPSELVHAQNLLLYIYSNKTVVGGFLGGLAGVELAKKKMGVRRASGDLFVYPILLALMIGRIGCFSMGVHEQTYGLPSSLPWAVDLGDGLRRHPVALYELVFLGLLWLCLRMLQRRVALREGGLFKLFMMTYLSFRFLLDIIKPHEGIVAGISTIQLACLGGLAYYGRYLAQPKKLTALYA